MCILLQILYSPSLLVLTRRHVYMLELSGYVDVNIIVDPIFSKFASVDKKTCVHA